MKKHGLTYGENEKRRKKYMESSSSDHDEWVEKSSETKDNTYKEREEWMSMTGMLKTYSREDTKPKVDREEKKRMDSYNPTTSSRELNPYWKNGGIGLPQTSDEFRKSQPFIKPNEMDDQGYYRKSYYTKDFKNSDQDKHQSTSKAKYKSYNEEFDSNKYSKSYNWKKGGTDKSHSGTSKIDTNGKHSHSSASTQETITTKSNSNDKDTGDKFLSDEKMNKLAAKIVKAEIMGDTKLVNELKIKLEAARNYRKENPNEHKKEQDKGVMLMSTSISGNSRPLSKPQSGDPYSKGGKRKAETHQSGERMKYFSNDDRYSLGQMFEEEKYGSNYNDEAQLAKIASKHKNPNDDLEDIFTDQISKNINRAKANDRERDRAIKEHTKMERTLEGCEYCVDSRNMLKHLMVSCGNKVYLALPSRKSLVDGHCLITTVQHAQSVISLDEDVWEEVLNYRKALTQFFNSHNKDVVFFETATRLHKFPHMVINCVPLPRDVGDAAPIYFKKAMLECEAEWSMNKKVIDLKGKNIRKGVPKGLPYFWIDFGMDPGYAHVIEDQQLFPKKFAEEIIGGILDLDHSLWKNPTREHGDQQRKKVLEFIRLWKQFDCMNKR